MKNAFRNLGEYYKEIETMSDPQSLAAIQQEQKLTQEKSIPMPPTQKRTVPIGLIIQQLLESVRRKRRLPVSSQVPKIDETQVSSPLYGFGRATSAAQAREAIRRQIMAQIEESR